MVAGPQILSAFFFATSDRWRAASAAYVIGAAISISTVVAIAFFLGAGAAGAGSDRKALYYVVLALLLIGVVQTFRGRKRAEPPKWMGKLQTASPRFAFTLGFLLLGVFPSDLVTSVSVGGYLAARNDPLWHYLGFLALTLLFLAIPALLVLLLRRRAETVLPRVRDWINDKSWVVNEIVLLLFVALVVSNLVTG